VADAQHPALQPLPGAHITLHSTLHPVPRTPHPALDIIKPTPCTPRPAPCTPNPAPWNLDR